MNEPFHDDPHSGDRRSGEDRRSPQQRGYDEYRRYGEDPQHGAERPPGEDLRSGQERRSGEELRSGEDARSGEDRRHVADRYSIEDRRRFGDERRSGVDRRSGQDRRGTGGRRAGDEHVGPEIDDSFWGWTDACVFTVLLVPSFLFALVMTNAFFSWTPAGIGATKAVRLMVFQFAIYSLWFVSLWAMFLIRYKKEFWPSMAWLVPWPHFYATLIAGPALVFTVALLGRWMQTPKVESALEKLLSDPLSVLVIGIFAVTLGPLSEELVFRGFFQPLLIRTFGVVGGIVAASLPFAILHGPQYQWSWRHMLLLFLASATFGVTRWWTRSTAAATLVHCSYNFTFLLGFILQKKGIIY